MINYLIYGPRSFFFCFTSFVRLLSSSIVLSVSKIFFIDPIDYIAILIFAGNRYDQRSKNYQIMRDDFETNSYCSINHPLYALFASHDGILVHCYRYRVHAQMMSEEP